MDNPFHTKGLRHGTNDPRGLLERIEAQLAERIEEAVEMAALELLVELRKRHQRAAPASDSQADRAEFQLLSADLLGYLREAFTAEMPAEGRAALARAEAGGSGERDRALRSQVFLAKQLPDYWQRFEGHRAAHATARLSAPPPPAGLLKRLFGS
jgi:hypothetical protein